MEDAFAIFAPLAFFRNLRCFSYFKVEIRDCGRLLARIAALLRPFLTALLPLRDGGLSQGFNCSCFAYGHTGSGKTYSMFGCSDDTSLPDDAEALAAPPQGEGFGLVPRVCFSLLHRLQEANEGKRRPVRHCGQWVGTLLLGKAVGCCYV